MKITILTFHPSLNCGAMLQAWALQKILTDLGHSVSFPKCNEFKAPRRFEFTFTRSTILGKLRNLIGWLINEIYCFPITDLKFYRMYRFSKKFFQIVRYTTKQLEENNDLIIVGSDQVWHENIAKTRLNFFLGEVFTGKTPLVGYALSWGDTSPSKTHITRLQRACERFKYVTVREPYAIPLLQTLTDKPIHSVVDPTLLLTAKDYEMLIPQKRLEARPYLFAYLVKRNDAILQKVTQIAESLGLRLVLVDVYRSPREKCRIKNKWAVTPDRFLNYIKYAEYVIVSSFHGCVFATLFKKPFIFLTDTPEIKNSRPSVLLETLYQTSRIASPNMPLQLLLANLRMPLSPELDILLDTLATESKARLLELIATAQQDFNDCTMY